MLTIRMETIVKIRLRMGGGGYLHGHPSWFGPTATVLLSQQHPNVGLNN